MATHAAQNSAHTRPSVEGSCCGCVLIKGRTEVGLEAGRSLRKEGEWGALKKSPAMWRLSGLRWGQLEPGQQEQRRNQKLETRGKTLVRDRSTSWEAENIGVDQGVSRTGEQRRVNKVFLWSIGRKYQL